MKHIKGLDALRAFAVFFVIIEHWGPHKFNNAPFLTFIFTRILPDGRFGVDLFFVLSGYLITKILINSRNDAQPNERLGIVKSFYMRRILRIFPIYFLLVFLVAYIFNDEYVKNHIGYFISYTSNFLVFKEKFYPSLVHTWSLSVEEQFYIIWPWLIIYTPRKYLLSLILATFIIGVSSTLILYNEYGEFSTLLLLPCVTAFSIGALYAYVQSDQRFKNTITIIFVSLLPFAIVLFVMHQMGNTFYLIRLINSVIAINLIMYVVSEKYNLVTKHLFNNKFLVGIGKISYGIYIYHYMLPRYYDAGIYYLQKKLLFSNKTFHVLIYPLWGYVFLYSLLLLVAVLSYRYIEVPFLKLKKHFSYISDKKVLMPIVNVVE